MAITEEGRHRLYQRLEELLGPDEATTLMEHLPPVGWADVATKRDIDHLAAMTKADLDNHAAIFRSDLDNHAAITSREIENHAAITSREIENHAAITSREIENQAAITSREIENLGNVLRVEFARELRSYLFAMLAANSTLAGLAFAAARFT